MGVSSCLLGENVRYNGEIKLNTTVKFELGKAVCFVPVCPETESGMPVPREPMDLFQADGSIRMITLESRRDMTGVMEEWIEKKLSELVKLELCGFVFKARSPSCAVNSALLHVESRPERNGEGLFAKAFIERFPSLPVEEGEKLHDPVRRAVFLEKVYNIHRARHR
ncbi:MAG: DUF523 domain-containing protein [Candidatus Fermentibacteria bacterium]|nr:DUF523 domain-containing protein [Candidatus Fermentibacteria bacterium]